MLEDHGSLPRVSTGVEALDEVLGGLYWGDNVVWELDAAPTEPFYNAIVERGEDFDTRTFISLTGPGHALAGGGLEVLEAGAQTALVHPADLLREIRRRFPRGGRSLLVFDSLDAMVSAWDANGARGFFARCCPLLLDLGAIAYWSMSTRTIPRAVRETVESVTQCVLRVDERTVRVVKAEGRAAAARGSVLHWHEERGRAVLEAADVIARLGASLRSLRSSRELSQQEMAQLAGVTASAISQAERAERGLSLTTLARLSTALGVTVDDLLHGEEAELYRIGRRVARQEADFDGAVALLGHAGSDLRVDLVRLSPRGAGAPGADQPGTGIVAVCSGLVQVQIERQTPALRAGEVLVVDSDRVTGWRNVGEAHSLLFWIVLRAPR